MTLGSLFDGIGGWLLAARHAGVTPIWASEIEPFPCSVTAQHFPEVKHLGDITKIDGAAIPPVDIICAGSPCQDLSIAGRREGLDGARSGLFRRAVDIVRQMRMSTRGGQPRFFVWENVPGAFSSNKGADFRAVLQKIGQTEIPMPTNGRWANAGVAELPECEIAWRVLDAQYWGVPQRRRRIFLVADFAAYDRRAGEILFEPEGVCGDSATGARARERAARGTEDCARATGKKCTRATGFCAGGSAGVVGYQVECAATLTTRWGGQAPTVAIYDMTHAAEVMRPVKEGVIPTLNALMGTGGNQVPVVHSYCIAGNTIDRKIKNGGNGKGILAETGYTLNTVDRHAVAEIYGSKSFCEYESGQVATLRAAGGNQGGGSENLVLCVGNGQMNQSHLQENAGALNCMHDQQIILTDTAVRRLTPTECERLQGLPDGYTAGGSDTARYKALGNGMAQPCADYVIRRIVEVTADAQGDRAIRRDRQGGACHGASAPA